MFKTLSHIIISLLLLITTTGMTISKHFCNENLISTSLYAETKSCCGEDSCCHHETEFFHLKENFQPSFTTQLPCSVEIDLIASEVSQLIYDDTALSNQPSFIEVKPPSPPKLQTFLSLKQAYLL